MALPAEETLDGDTDVILRYRVDGILNPSSVWKNIPDAIGFTVMSPSHGWLVLHYPYDEKWRLTIDGEETRFYRINGAFLGVPIKRGDHQVLLEYWPGSPVRYLIPISVSLSLLTLFALIFVGCRLLGDAGAGTSHPDP